MHLQLLDMIQFQTVRCRKLSYKLILEMQGMQNKAMTAEELLKIVQVVLKDELAAVIRKRGDELTITFPGGERFALTLWKETKKP